MILKLILQWHNKLFQKWRYDIYKTMNLRGNAKTSKMPFIFLDQVIILINNLCQVFPI